MIQVSERASELLAKALAAARRFDPQVTIRIVGEPGAVRFELADACAPDDRDLPLGDETIHVAPHLTGVVDVEDPHDRLVLRPIE